jgi:hypothetical protein
MKRSDGLGSIASLWPCAGHFRSSPNKRTFSGAPPCLNGAISGQPVAAELWTSVTDLQPEAW